MEDLTKNLGKIVGGILIILASLALCPWIIMLCWNYVMPIFGLATITFWQSVALFVIGRLILGGTNIKRD